MLSRRLAETIARQVIGRTPYASRMDGVSGDGAGHAEEGAVSEWWLSTERRVFSWRVRVGGWELILTWPGKAPYIHYQFEVVWIFGPVTLTRREVNPREEPRSIVHGIHVFCSDECAEGCGPDFDCFDDGCAFECCGCGSCRNPAHCPDTGKGYAWHA